MVRTKTTVYKTLNGKYLQNRNPKKTTPEPRMIRQHFYKVLQQISLKKIKYHGLRHTFALRCINSGCNYKAVSEMLDHSKNITLNLHVHPDMEEKRYRKSILNRSKIIHLAKIGL